MSTTKIIIIIYIYNNIINIINIIIIKTETVYNLKQYSNMHNYRRIVATN